jgi:hypothetical protein
MSVCLYSCHHIFVQHVTSSVASVDASKRASTQQHTQSHSHYCIHSLQHSLNQNKIFDHSGSNVFQKSSASLSLSAKKNPREFRGLKRLHWRIRVFAKSETLQNILLFTIIINTILMVIDHKCDFCDLSYKCNTFKGALEVSNMAFAGVFVIELLVKWIGLGLINYFKSAMNWLDALVVVSSLVELPAVWATYSCYSEAKSVCEEWHACDEAAAVFTVLRIFRWVENESAAK